MLILVALRLFETVDATGYFPWVGCSSYALGLILSIIVGPLSVGLMCSISPGGKPFSKLKFIFGGLFHGTLGNQCCAR